MHEQMKAISFAFAVVGGSNTEIITCSPVDPLCRYTQSLLFLWLTWC